MPLKGRAIAFALSVGAAAFLICLISSVGRPEDFDVVRQAVIPAMALAAICWVGAERAVTSTAAAIDAAIRRMAQAARGDLDSPIPAEVGECVPPLSIAMRDLFDQLRTNLDNVEHLALYDTTTGLPNRNQFRARADAALAALRPDDRAALLFIDLDRFKAVNDSLGHAAGDQLLAQVAERLNAISARLAAEGIAPLVGRLAGDEFTLFLTGVAGGEAVERASRAILAALSDPFDVQGHAVEIGASIGVALCPDHGSDLSDLMKAADAAMYHAKEGGRGRVDHFGPVLAERITARKALDAALRQAIVLRQFELAFQPQVALNDGRVVAAEALLRWRHPVEGIKLPGTFIQRAEETGLIVEIGDWVVDAVAATLARWSAAGHGCRLSINLSARQIEHATFFRRLRSALAVVGADIRLLELEVNEALAMACSETALGELAAMRADGVTIAMDAFGTGFSNLGRLRLLPLDRVKIDRSVIAGVADDTAARTIVQALVGLIHGLGCEAVAEGVETGTQADVLRVIGCDVLQGTALGAPMPEQEFLAQPSARASTAA